MQWPWKKSPAIDSESYPETNDQESVGEEAFTSYHEESKNDFSLYWFFLVFWLTVIATVLISWKMII